MSLLLNPYRFGSAYAAAVLADAPLQYLKMNETSGTTAADSSGNGKHGTYVGSPTLGAAALFPGGGTGVTFDGVNDIVQTGSLAITAEAACTVEWWMAPTSAIDKDSAAKIVYVPNTSDSAGNYFATGAISAALTNEVLTVVETTNTHRRAYTTATVGAISTAAHHVVVRWSGSAWTIWLDGVQVDNAGSMAASGWPEFTNGRFGGRDSDLYFPGRCGHLAVYAGALSDARIAAHYAAA